MRLSHTAIDLFHQCARRYYWERVLKIREPDTEPLVVGSLYHKILERLTRNPAADVDEAVRVSIRDAAEALVRLEIDIDDLDLEIRENLTKIDFNWIVAHKVGQAPLVEAKFFNDDLNLCGVIDLVNQHTPVPDAKGVVQSWIKDEPCVLDFKVVNSRRKSQRDADLSAQLAIYCLETKVKTAGFYEIPRNLERPHHVRLKTFTDQELGEWQRWLACQCVGIQAIHPQGPEFFPMTKRSNPLCSQMWCPHWDRCYGKQGDT
jgi:hypothetical protein